MYEILFASVTQIIVAMITLVGVVITAFYAVSSHKHAREINEAVNRRHTRANSNGEVPPHMFDLVIDTHDQVLKMEPKVEGIFEWKESYKDSPLNTGEGVEKFINEFDELKGYVEGLNCRAEYPCDNESCGRRKPKDPE